MPTISVIVPVYNVEKYIHRCIDSILDQTFTDFELILVDDGSPDNCGAICDEYAKKDSRIHVIHQEKGGPSGARNAGIDWAFKNSDSEWISFVDSDDWIHPTFLEYLKKSAEDCGTAVSVCGFLRVSQYEITEQTQNEPIKYVWDEFYLQDPVTAAVPWNKLYKKRLLEGFRYPVAKIHEDEFLTYKVLYRSGYVAFVPARLYYYFQNKNGIMQSSFSLKRLDSIDALEEQCRFAERIKNKAFYEDRILAYVMKLYYIIPKIQNSTTVSPDQKEKSIKKLKNKLRRALICHHKIVPIREYSWYYEYSLPFISRLFWVKEGIIYKLKRRGKK